MTPDEYWQVLSDLMPLLITLAVMGSTIAMLSSLTKGLLDDEPRPKKVKPVKAPKVRRAGWGMRKVACPACGKVLKIPKKAPFGHTSEPVDCEFCRASFRPYMVVGQ